MTKHQKTNAVRLVEAKGVAHEIFTYEAEDGVIDAVGVAEKLGLDPASLFKTLVARAERNVYVFCIPGNEELDLKKAAKAAGEKRVELVAVKELLPLTGYVRGGCSPVPDPPARGSGARKLPVSSSCSTSRSTSASVGGVAAPTLASRNLKRRSLRISST